MIPAVTTEDTDKLDNLRGVIEELRDFGYDPSELVESIERPRGIKGRDDENIVPDLDRLGKIVGEIIEEYEHRIEEEKIANMSFEEKIQLIGGKIVELNLIF
jgi:hypothetical protein